MRLVVVIVAALLVVCAVTALAEVYKYTDSRGELNFVDDTARVPKKYRKQLENAQPLAEISVMDAAPALKPRKSEGDPKPQQKVEHGSAKVELFMTSWCGYCKKMVRFLEEKGIPYTAHDIEKDEAAFQTYRSLGGRGVPVVRVGSHVVHGYNPEGVLSSLEMK